MPNLQQKAKEWFWLLLNLVLVVAVLAGLLAIKTLFRLDDSLMPARTITVSADGKTTVSPDIASVSFSVVSEGADPDKISAANSQKINSAIDFVKSQGVDEKDIKTAGYNLAPKYEYDKDKRTTFISGYTLTQTVFLKIRDFSKIGKILGALPGLGINQIGSLNFDIENPDKYLNDARQQAFDKAFAKAKAMAEQNHVGLSRVVTFSESHGGYPYPVPMYGAASVGIGAITPPMIEPGSQEVTVNVSVVYEID